MTTVLVVALDIVREAASRRWFLALGTAITLLLALTALSLRLEVVDGAVAATRLFGQSMHSDIQAVDVALRPVFTAVSYVIYYGGLVFGILSCADFGPSLLAPGRIEHLLSLPVRRWELLVGTFLGVQLLALAGALYGAGGMTVVLGAKTGVWTLRPLIAAVVAALAFAAIYGPMLASAVFARSPALSAAVGMLVFVAGIVSGYRTDLASLFHEGLARGVFEAVMLPLPRISEVGAAAASLAGSLAISATKTVSALAGLVLFGAGALMIGIWRFEQKDF